MEFQNHTVARVRKIISDRLGIGIEKVRSTSRFEDDFGADSLDMADIIIALEDEFNLPFINDVVRNRVVTVADMVALVENAGKLESTNG